MKKKRKNLLAFLCCFLLICFFAYAQSTEIRGKVVSTENEPLPGAEVSLSSPNLIGGNQTRITDSEGRFRFVALLSGIYTVEAKLQGFIPKMQSDLRLSAGRTLTVEFILEIGSLEEEVTVVAQAPIIDVKDSQTVTTTLKTEFLEKFPNRGVEGALDFTPGVFDNSAFGAAVSNSNNYQVNGISVNDPEAGEMGMSPEYDSIEEISVMGVGAPAEYGGYSGAIVNTVMKSGGNDFHGMANIFLRLPSFHSVNWGGLGEDFIRKNWSESYDGNFNLGGPIIKDKLWFFASSHYERWYDRTDDYDGPVENGRGARFAGKLTWQAGTNDRLSFWAAIEPQKSFNYGFDPRNAPETSTNEPHTNILFNSSNLHTFSNTTFLEWKIGGFRNLGQNEVDKNGTPARLELTTDILSGNYPVTYYRKALRIQTNVVLSHHAEDFITGDHDFKFGADIEISNVNISYFYPSDKYYLDYEGMNYILDEWDGEEGNTKSRRFSGFVQDSWQITDRLVLNPGLRINYWRGYVPSQSTAVYAPKLGIAPRFGLTFDLFGDHTTALKAHYGKYYHGIMAQFYMRLQPQGAFREYVWGEVYNMWSEEAFEEEGEHFEGYPFPEDEWILDFEDVWENEYTVDPNLKMAYMNQYVIGIERELMKDVSVGASFIYRTNHDFQDKVNITGMWEPTTWTSDYEGSPVFGKTYNVYERLNPGENKYYLTNPKEGEDFGAAFPGIVGFSPSRKYRGLQLTFEKRYSNRWMLSASYVLSRSWGTDDNDWGEWGDNRGSMLGASTMYSNPNYQINAYGPLTIDPTHQVSIYGALDIPVIEVTLGLSYDFNSGTPYSSNVLIPRNIDSDPVSWADDVYIYGEERGTYRYPAIHNVDLRLEKYFQIGRVRVGALIDVFNVLNSSTETSYETTIDPRSDFPFGYLWRIRSPRQWRLGFRFEF
jgi:hypothetical protein